MKGEPLRLIQLSLRLLHQAEAIRTLFCHKRHKVKAAVFPKPRHPTMGEHQCHGRKRKWPQLCGLRKWMGVYPSFNFWVSFCLLHLLYTSNVENSLWSLSRATVLFVTLPAKNIHEGSGKDSCRGCAPDLLIEFVAFGLPGLTYVR